MVKSVFGFIAVAGLSIWGLNAKAAAELPFAGSWHGQGQVKMGEMTIDCETVDIDLEQTESSFQMKLAKFSCGGMDQEMAGKSFEIRGSELWYNSEKVGSISEDKVSYQFSTPKSISSSTYTIDGETLILSEEVRGQDGGNGMSTVVKATLLKKRN